MQDENEGQGTLTRRAFLRATGATVAVAAFGAEIAAADAIAPNATIVGGPPVASVFLDRPYVDPTGRAEPYRPPAMTGAVPPPREDCCVIAFL